MAQLYDKIVIRNDIEANWVSANPVLLEGEVGITMDTTPKKFKIGNGTSVWADLLYEKQGIAISDIPGLQAALDAKEDEFTKNTAFNKNFGNTAGTVCEGNDSRLSDSRIPLPHNQEIDTINGLTSALSNKEPLRGAGDNYVTDAQLVVISNTSGTNTGDQDLSGLQPKEIGKGLSTNDYTDTDRDLVATIPNKADTSSVPTKLSDLDKDINFDERYYTESEIDTKLLTKSDTSHNHSLNSLTEKSYNSLTDKPTIPTDFNTLYYTKSEIDTKIGDIETLLEAI